MTNNEDMNTAITCCLNKARILVSELEDIQEKLWSIISEERASKEEVSNRTTLQDANLLYVAPKMGDMGGVAE